MHRVGGGRQIRRMLNWQLLDRLSDRDVLRGARKSRRGGPGGGRGRLLPLCPGAIRGLLNGQNLHRVARRAWAPRRLGARSGRGIPLSMTLSVGVRLSVDVRLSALLGWRRRRRVVPGGRRRGGVLGGVWEEGADDGGVGPALESAGGLDGVLESLEEGAVLDEAARPAEGVEREHVEDGGGVDEGEGGAAVLEKPRLEGEALDAAALRE